MTKTFTFRVNDMTHARIQSLLQKENYNQTDINKLLEDLLLDQFKESTILEDNAANSFIGKDNGFQDVCKNFR